MTFEDVMESIQSSESQSTQYNEQIRRISDAGLQTDCVSDAVDTVISDLPESSTNSLVIYGDPQSGKTEMMICLTAALLDNGYRTVVHLMNDNVDLLKQNLNRFRESRLSPSPRLVTELSASPIIPNADTIIFCKKNTHDLQKLLDALENVDGVVVIDDEADYATPNSKVNSDERTRINEKIYTLIGDEGIYIGVTATPARLNLNNTFDNLTENWVRFRPHDNYTGQDTFFPMDRDVDYRLKLIDGDGGADDAREAFARFLVTVALLNLDSQSEKNYTFLMHTSGRKDDHDSDREQIGSFVRDLMDPESGGYSDAMRSLYDAATTLYPLQDASRLLLYVSQNIARHAFIVLNSRRDRNALGDDPTVPKCPFTIIIGGNIVSRGVTFPNLLTMYFTRDVKTKIQQDTYIQRARMFGSRGNYLKHFELTIPKKLYSDWHRAFFFHNLALQSIKDSGESPVWIGDKRISVVSAASIDRATVNFAKGEMSFEKFDFEDTSEVDAIAESESDIISRIRDLKNLLGEAFPDHLATHLVNAAVDQASSVVIHACISIAGYQDEQVVESITRDKGFIGRTQLKPRKYPDAKHHLFVLYNEQGSARLVYKNQSSIQFIQNTIREH